jgi:hypothetical protein
MKCPATYRVALKRHKLRRSSRRMAGFHLPAMIAIAVVRIQKSSRSQLQIWGLTSSLVLANAADLGNTHRPQISFPGGAWGAALGLL